MALESFFQAAKKFLISDYGNHRAKRHHFYEQLCFHALIIIDQTFVSILIYFGGILLIIGKMEHGAL